MITKYLVINVIKSDGILTNKVVGMFAAKQDAEAYVDKYDKRSLDSYLITATLQLDDNGKFVSDGFNDYIDDTPVMDSLVEKFAEHKDPYADTPLEELFADDPQGIKDEMAELK